MQMQTPEVFRQVESSPCFRFINESGEVLYLISIRDEIIVYFIEDAYDSLITPVVRTKTKKEFCDEMNIQFIDNTSL